MDTVLVRYIAEKTYSSETAKKVLVPIIMDGPKFYNKASKQVVGICRKLQKRLTEEEKIEVIYYVRQWLAFDNQVEL